MQLKITLFWVVALAVLGSVHASSNSRSNNCDRSSSNNGSGKKALKKPEVFVNFDDRKFNGACFNGKPKFEVLGSVTQGEGIHDEAAVFDQMELGSNGAECLVSEPVPDECPFNMLKCECGATISFWAFFPPDLFQDDCSFQFFFGRNAFALSKFGPTTLVNVVVNGAFTFCPLEENMQDALANSWTHIAITVKEGNDSMAPHLFLNGTEPLDLGDCIRFNAPFLNPFFPNIFLGCRPNHNKIDTECGMTGRLDDFRLFGHELSREQIDILADPDTNLKPRRRGPCDDSSSLSDED